MKRIKIDSIEGMMIGGTILKYVEHIVPANGVLYSEKKKDSLDEEGCFNTIVQALADGHLRLASDGEKTMFLQPVDENPQPKQIFMDSFFGKYNEVKALFKK